MQDADYPALLLLNAVFGACYTSKLFLHVREERSLCYYASSSLEKYKGLMVVNSGVDFAQFETARDAILAELDACRRGEISDYELESARKQCLLPALEHGHAVASGRFLYRQRRGKN